MSGVHVQEDVVTGLANNLGRQAMSFCGMELNVKASYQSSPTDSSSIHLNGSSMTPMSNIESWEPVSVYIPRRPGIRFALNFISADFANLSVNLTYQGAPFALNRH